MIASVFYMLQLSVLTVSESIQCPGLSKNQIISTRAVIIIIIIIYMTAHAHIPAEPRFVRTLSLKANLPIQWYYELLKLRTHNGSLTGLNEPVFVGPEQQLWILPRIRICKHFSTTTD